MKSKNFLELVSFLKKNGKVASLELVLRRFGTEVVEYLEKNKLAKIRRRASVIILYFASIEDRRLYLKRRRESRIEDRKGLKLVQKYLDDFGKKHGIELA